MRDALVDLLDKVDIAVAESRGVLDPAHLEPSARLAADTRLRLSYPEEILVVALAGGTGSGKSSVFNAIAGAELALTGGIRPMTVAPLVAIPEQHAGTMGGYLDAMGIADRIGHAGPSWLCLIDLPDSDSVELDHRYLARALLPRVDMVIWVTDPEKYRDATFHREQVAPLAGYQEQFLFVLNQVDRLAAEEVRSVLADLVDALDEDGIVDPEVIPTSAQPPAGPPIGVDRLLEVLEDRHGQRDAVHRKLLAHMSTVASQLVASSSGAHGVEFEKRWASAVEEAVRLAMSGEIGVAGDHLARLVGVLAAEVGGETRGSLEELAERVPSLFVACAVEATTQTEGDVSGGSNLRDRLRRRGRASSTESTLAEDRLESEVNNTIGDPIRDLLARRGRAHASIAELALAVGAQARRAKR